MSMSNATYTRSRYMLELFIIFFALLLGMLLFFGITVYIYIAGSIPPDADTGRLMLYILIPLLLVEFVLLAILPQRILSTIKTEWDLGQKLARYRTLTIIRLALLEFPALFALVAFMMSQQLYFAYIFGIIILIFLTHAPRIDKIIHTLSLSHEERMRLEHNEPFEMTPANTAR